MQKVKVGLLIAFYIVNIVVSLILGHISNFYNPNIKSTFSGFIASILGIIATLLIATIEKYSYSKTALTINFIILLVLSCLGIGFQFALAFNLGGWACILWLICSLLLGYQLKFNQKMKSKLQVETVQRSIPLNDQTKDHNNLYSNQTVVTNSLESLQKKQQKTCSERCVCCHACCSIATLFIMAVYVSVAIVIFSNWAQQPIYGQIIDIKSQNNSQTYYVHAYCIGTAHSTRPTIFLQHGGGSNSMAFAQLGQLLSVKNWKMCSYDRLGYGRSSVIPRFLNRQQYATITNKVISKMVQNDTNKNIIMGGWSAGVQLSQIYKKNYPNQIQGMIFLDGYPDYLALIGIYENKSQPISSNTIGTLQIVRILQPLGLAFITGSNQIQNATLKNYYKSYYQTGYFWESQYFDVLNPDKTTDWLTSKAGNDIAPYPDAKFTLNWPNIDVPLLVMPANNTVTDKQYGASYLQQCNKYLGKCTNVNKRITVMNGDHGFVLKTPQDVANQIDSFFSPLF